MDGTWVIMRVFRKSPESTECSARHQLKHANVFLLEMGQKRTWA